MFRIPALLALLVVGCSPGRETGTLHHPDLVISGLARTTEGNAAIFTNYRPNGPSLWNQSWPWKLDLTGIAWDRSNTATVITPRHVVMASHYIRKPGQKLIYHDRTGKSHQRTLLKVVHFKDRNFVGDVAVGLLDRPLPKSIRCYPLPTPHAEAGSSLIGAMALITEQNRALFFHRIGSIHQNGLSFRYDDQVPKNRRKRLIAGDSGHPSFLLSNGELVLIQTHTGGGPGSGPFYGSKGVNEGLRAITQELDPSYRFRTVIIDSRTLKDAEVGRAQLSKTTRPSNQTPPQTAPHQESQLGEARKPRPRVVIPPQRTQ